LCIIQITKRCFGGKKQMSSRIIAAFSSEKNTENIAQVLEKHGVTVNCRCTTGQEVVAAIGETGSGVVICGPEFQDMTAEDLPLWVDEPSAFLVIGTDIEIKDSGAANIFTMPLPVKGGELAGAVNMLVQLVDRKTRLMSPRTMLKDDELTIIKAQNRLMKKTHITEDQAMDYIRRKSMETSSKMADVAAVILKALG
jgi:AmiR/NasT family two-component response regulator